MDWNIVTSALITAATGVVGAVVGGVMSRRASLEAAEAAHQHALKLEKKKEEAQIRGLLRSISCELRILGEVYGMNAGRSIEALKDDEPLMMMFSLTERYFIVYPSNTALTGQIPDAELVKLIIETYNKGNVLIELWRINNEYIRRYLDAERDLKTMEPNPRVIAGRGQRDLLPPIEQARKIKEAHKSLQTQTATLLKRIDEFLQEHPG